MKNKNEMCQFSTLSEKILVPANVTAELAGCSESAVKKVRNGFRGKTGKGKVCQKIVVTDQLLRSAIALGVEHVASVINADKKFDIYFKGTKLNTKTPAMSFEKANEYISNVIMNYGYKPEMIEVK